LQISKNLDRINLSSKLWLKSVPYAKKVLGFLVKEKSSEVNTIPPPSGENTPIYNGLEFL